MIKEFTFDFVRGFFHDNQSTFNIQCIYDQGFSRLTLFVDFFMTTNRHSIFNAYMIKEFSF